MLEFTYIFSYLEIGMFTLYISFSHYFKDYLAKNRTPFCVSTKILDDFDLAHY